MMQNITHKNHYIPKFYLKNWSIDGKTIQTYSLLVSHSKVPYWTQQSIKNTAVWNDFYTRMEGNKEVDDFEHWFNREFETPAKPVFEKLLNGQKLSREESIILSHFVFAQYIRTPAACHKFTKYSMQIFPKALNEAVIELEKVNKQIQKGYPIPRFISNSENELFPLKVMVDKEKSEIKVNAVIGKGLYLYNLKRLLSSTLKVVEHHNWQVLHASEDVSFPTSDDPVICLNYKNDYEYNFEGGWGRKNCNILMPISPRLILFTQVGKRKPCNALDFSSRYSKLFRRMIIQHAHRCVYADQPQKGMLALNARVVNRMLYEKEKQSMAGWHIEQMQAEQNL